jgi:5-methylcytosine-specific restriction endonuclease McrA
MALICIVPDCKIPSTSKIGYCLKHYACWKRNGTPIPKQPQRLSCSIEDCQEKHRRNGFCEKHSSRVARHGSPDAYFPNAQNREERYAALKERQRKYDQTPKGRAAAVLKRHRRRQKEPSDVKLSVADVQAVIAKFDGRCFKCGSPDDSTLDHHIPVTHGGKLEFSNTVILCRKCNGLKADLSPEDFYSAEELTRLHQLLASSASNV